MFVLDTNVVSELRKPTPRLDRNVAAWAEAAPDASLFLSAIVIEELEIGVLRMERRDRAQGAILRRWLEEGVLIFFAERILPVDTAVARRCASLHVPDPRPVRDAFIGATALVHGMTLVTRNVADYAPMGVRALDPWKIGAI